MKLKQPKCPNCGSEDISCSGIGNFRFSSQQWEFERGEDDFWCQDCDAAFSEPKWEENETSILVPTCTECGGTEVLLDAFAEYDPLTEGWELRSTGDDAYCEICDCSCSLEMREAP